MSSQPPGHYSHGFDRLEVTRITFKFVSPFFLAELTFKIHTPPIPMQRSASHSKQKGDFKAFLFCIVIGALLMLGVGAIFYFMNQSPDLLPEAKPGNPVENKSSFR